MACRTHRIVILPLLLAVLLALPNGGVAAPRRPGRMGGFEPIPDPEDAKIQALAKFAVRQHRKDTGEYLTLTRVLGGQQQVVAGMNYLLVLGAAGRNHVEGLYLAKVYEREWDNVRELNAFDPIV